jgi:hypothetical protein
MYIHLMTIHDDHRSKALFALPCACQNLRRLTRLVTRIYDQELRDADIEITQFGLLTALAIVGEANQKALSAGFAMDSTTLSRTLALLRSRKKANRNGSATLAGCGTSLAEDVGTFGMEANAGHRRPNHERGNSGLIFCIVSRCIYI